MAALSLAAVSILMTTGCASTPAADAGAESNAAREDIRMVMRENKAPVQACYSARVKAVPHLRGRMIVDWVVLGDGTVGPVRVVKSLDLVVDACVTEVVKNWKFPPHPDNSVVKVRYPFVFRSN